MRFDFRASPARYVLAVGPNQSTPITFQKNFIEESVDLIPVHDYLPSSLW